jgi:hypothetical protein
MTQPCYAVGVDGPCFDTNERSRPRGQMMTKQWTKPVFEEFDVNGECTAYAGAERADRRPQELGAGGRVVARRETLLREPATGRGLTGSRSRDTIR